MQRQEMTISLSNREQEVLHALAMGQTRQSIADNLHISIYTYDSYRKSIRQKLRIKNQMDWSHVLVNFQLDSLND